MNLLNDVKVSLKLSILIVIALLSMCIIGYTGYYYFQHSNEDLNSMYEDQLLPVALINENRSHLNKTNSAVLELMLTTDDKRDNELKKIIDERVKAFNDNLTELEKINLDEKSKTQLNEIKTVIVRYRNIRQPVIELALQNKNAEAYALYVSTVESLFDEVNNKCIELSESAEQVAASSEELTASAQQSAQAANQVAESISEVAVGAEKQVNAVNQTTAILEKITTSLQQVDTNTNLAAEKSTQAVEKSKIGSLSVIKAVNQMTKIE